MANSHSVDFEKDSVQYASITNDLGIGGGNITIEAWIYLESAPGSNVIFGIADQCDVTTDVSYWLQYRDDSGTKKLQFCREKQGVASNTASYTVTLSTATWYHVVGTYDGTDVKIFEAAQSGSHTERASTGSTGNGTNFGSDHFGIGIEDRGNGEPYAPNSTTAFDGLIDDVRVWSTARSAANMNGDFESELVGNETNLVAYYKLNNDYEDGTANNFDLTATNSPTFSTTIPFGAASGPANLKSYNTNLKANAKSINTNLIANVKSLNTNT